MCFIHDANEDSTVKPALPMRDWSVHADKAIKGIWDFSEQEREHFWEGLYASRGFGMWLSNYKEMLRDQQANDLVSAFIANKIRSRVNDPATAETLIPKNHGFGSRRVPMETFYYEAYNRENVHLVDLLKTPIERITEKGVQTEEGEYEFDMLIYATGFDAVTGSFDAIDFVGNNGIKMRDEWEEGPRTYLGMVRMSRRLGSTWTLIASTDRSVLPEPFHVSHCTIDAFATGLKSANGL